MLGIRVCWGPVCPSAQLRTGARGQGSGPGAPSCRTLGTEDPRSETRPLAASRASVSFQNSVWSPILPACLVWLLSKKLNLPDCWQLCLMVFLLEGTGSAPEGRLGGCLPPGLCSGAHEVHQQRDRVPVEEACGPSMGLRSAARALAGSDSAVACTGLPNLRLHPADGVSPHGTSAPRRPLHRLPARPHAAPLSPRPAHTHTQPDHGPGKAHGRLCAGYEHGGAQPRPPFTAERSY